MILRIANTLALLSLTALSALACQKTPPQSGGNADKTAKIHRIDDFNRKDEGLDSHKGVEGRSTLEPIYEYQQVIPTSVLGCTKPIYPRVKKCADGSYIMLYQQDQVASTIYYTKSDDLINWTSGRRLFTPYDVTTTAGNTDNRRFSSADAAVLSNGDILAVVAFRANKAYRTSPADNGIMMKRSTDNGATWSDEQVIYVGTTWEPYLLELPSGELQCYFTDAEPQLKNSGTSMVVSGDGGKTWNPTGTSNAYKVIRQYKYDNGSTPIYTDQMPSVRLLNDGHTLLGFMEARLETSATSGDTSYWMSLVYGKDQWKSLSEGETGPEDRQSNLFKGAAGYVSQFRSGETLISCNISSIFSMKIGSCDGRTFNGTSWTDGWIQPFPERGFWGATEVISTHEVLGAMHTAAGGIQFGKFYLNHRLLAPRTSITLDGYNSDWTSDQALFLGSVSDEDQATIRAAHDGERLYVIVERADKYISASDAVNVYLTTEEGGLDKAVKIAAKIDGTAEITGSSDSWKGSTDVDARCAVNVLGTPDDGRSDEGVIVEISVPLSAFGTAADSFLIDAELIKGSTKDSFTGATVRNTDSWMLIQIEK